MDHSDDEYASSDESRIIDEENRLEREYFHRGNENFPLILTTTKGRPPIIYEDRGYTFNKRRHNFTDDEGFDTIYFVSAMENAVIYYI